MDDRTKRQTELSNYHRGQIRLLIDNVMSPLNDFSTPPADARAHLADHKIHKHHIDAMCIEVTENWPDIQSIECGVHGGRYPYIAIRIDPHDQINAKRHDILIEHLRNRFPEYRMVSFYCLGEDRPFAVSAATPLYRRAA